MANEQRPVLITVDGRGPSPERDCIDCLVALPVAIDRMRADGDDIAIPQSMINSTNSVFDKLDLAPDNGLLVAATGVTDLLYRNIAKLTIMDHYTYVYFGRVVRNFVGHLSSRNVRTFYILDNALREDRFGALVTLLEGAGIPTVTPPHIGKEWVNIEMSIRQKMETLGHVAYIEPDAEVNHIEAAKTLAREYRCVATFRNRPPEDPTIEIIEMSTAK